MEGMILFWKKSNSKDIVPLEDNNKKSVQKRSTYLTKRPKSLKNAVKKTGNNLILPKEIQKLSLKEIRYIMAKIKSGDFKRYDRNKKGHNLLHIFSGLGANKLVKAFVEMIQADPNVLNALDNDGKSPLDYATMQEIKKLIQTYGGKKSVQILEQYSREAMAFEKSMGDSSSSTKKNAENQRQ